MKDNKQNKDNRQPNHAPGRGGDKQHPTDRDYQYEKSDKSKKGNIQDNPGNQNTG